MRINYSMIVLIVTFLCGCIGCSQAANGNYITQPDFNGLQKADTNIPLLWGIWDVSISPEGAIEVAPPHTAAFALNVNGLLGPFVPDIDFHLVQISHPSGFTDVMVDVGITNPQSSGGIYTGFDVCGIVMGTGGAVHPYDPTLTYGGQFMLQLLNADGYTRWMNSPEFSDTDPAWLGYTPGPQGSPGFIPAVTLNPYKYYCDGLGSEENAYDYLAVNSSSRGIFTEGATNWRRYILRFPDATGIQFQYAILACYAFNINHPNPPVNIPDDFPPNANAKEAVAIDVINDTSDMWNDGSSNGGNFSADVSVLNWNAKPGAGDVMSEYVIYIYSNAWVGGVTPDMTVISQGDNHCTYNVNIPATPAAAGALDVWITVAHPGATYANPFGVATGADDKTLAAHFKYTANVSNQHPSGEFWQPPVGHAPRFLFIHHSTGEGFLFDGGMWDMLENAGFEVHDITYGDGWIGDNTDPEHFPITFTEYYDEMIHFELPAGQFYDIVAFKSCFPASNIYDDQMLNDYYGYYATVKSVTKKHPETLFIPFSTPPLVPADTEPANAARARIFANWLKGTYDDGEFNMRSYDVFNVLAGNNPASGDFNMLRYDYQGDPYDSHPNHTANTTVAADFTAWLSDLVW